MARKRGSHLGSVDANFFYGGENNSPIEPQPGLTEEEKWSFVIRYGADNAAVETMQSSVPYLVGSLGNFALQQEMIQLIYSRYPILAKVIEADRQGIADAYNDGTIWPS